MMSIKFFSAKITFILQPIKMSVMPSIQYISNDSRLKVFRDRQEQIEEKLEEVQREREESLRQREQLIQEMEVANQMTQRDLEKAEEQKEALKLDLKGQVGGRLGAWWSDIYTLPLHRNHNNQSCRLFLCR